MDSTTRKTLSPHVAKISSQATSLPKPIKEPDRATHVYTRAWLLLAGTVK